ncbi:MAG: HD domain-containing protein [Clostridia bacterium]|nr:HD domain-containing protein [Clostridia bacterium]
MFKGVNKELEKYFRILSKDIPDFLYEYVDTPEMQKQAGISVSCGTIYSKMFDHKFWYSTLDHSIAVALIIWNFTKDKKQTLAGLFHDIATPVFKHSIDFMNGDYEKQESTEELTTKIISNSEEIMKLLKRDNIKVEEVDDYHIYPIADNDTPMLSADRLEYTFSNGLGATECLTPNKQFWDTEKIKEIYQDIEIGTNEEGIEELSFKNIEKAEEFVHIMSKLSSIYIRNKTKYSMQLLADIMKKMSVRNIITKIDLYRLSEKEIIEKIENCKEDNISDVFNIWKNSTKINESEEKVNRKILCSG